LNTPREGKIVRRKRKESQNWCSLSYNSTLVSVHLLLWSLIFCRQIIKLKVKKEKENQIQIYQTVIKANITVPCRHRPITFSHVALINFLFTPKTSLIFLYHAYNYFYNFPIEFFHCFFIPLAYIQTKYYTVL